MTSMSEKAYSGAPPGHIPHRNGFDWVLGQPFREHNDYTPENVRVPEIDADRKILVDEKSGMS